MSLEQQLAAIREGGAKRIPADSLAIMHRATEQLQASGLAERALGVGDQMPEFALRGQAGNEVRSSDLLGGGALVLTFFRGVW
jgi:hypothetical protein